jgi:hypothetical protein
MPSPGSICHPVVAAAHRCCSCTTAILEKTIAAEKERLIVDYDDCLTLYESQFCAYMTWLDEDARAGSVLTASMEDHFAIDIVDFERTHQMWPFLYQKYESTGQSTYLAAIHQE